MGCCQGIRVREGQVLEISLNSHQTWSRCASPTPCLAPATLSRAATGMERGQTPLSPGLAWGCWREGEMGRVESGWGVLSFLSNPFPLHWGPLRWHQSRVSQPRVGCHHQRVPSTSCQLRGSAIASLHSGHSSMRTTRQSASVSEPVWLKGLWPRSQTALAMCHYHPGWPLLQFPGSSL